MFKKALMVAAIAAVVGMPGLAFAQAAAAPASPHTLTGNVGVFSEYVFRGLSQTNQKPALQGGFDYTHSSGIYAGVWASNVSWISDPCNLTANQVAMRGCPSASLEIDTYFGYKNTFGTSDWTYDVGFLRYNYPGNYPPLYGAGFGAVKPNTNEIYAAIGWKWLTAKLSYSLGDTFGFDDARGSYYTELNASIPLGETGFTFSGHVGYQKFTGGLGGVNAPTLTANAIDNDAWSYYDWKIGVNKEWWGLNFGLALKGTDADGTGGTGAIPIWNNAYGRNLGKTRAVVSVQKTF